MRAGFGLGVFEIHPGANELVGPAGAVHVEPRVMQVLEELASHPGEVVSREELLAAVWKDTSSAMKC